MAGFLQKLGLGFAQAGAKIYADQHMQEMQADLIAKRDETLHRNKLEYHAQKAETEKAEAEKIATAKLTAAEQKERQKKLTPEFRKKEIEAEKASLQLESIKKVREAAESGDEDAYKKAILAYNTAHGKELGRKGKLTGIASNAKSLVDAGLEPDMQAAYAKLKSDKSFSRVVALATAMEREQALRFLQPGDPGYTPFVDFLTKAQDTMSAMYPDTVAPTAAPAVTAPIEPIEPSIGGAPTVDSQSEYDALPSGSYYIDASDGKRYRKP